MTIPIAFHDSGTTKGGACNIVLGPAEQFVQFAVDWGTLYRERTIYRECTIYREHTIYRESLQWEHRIKGLEYDCSTDSTFTLLLLSHQMYSLYLSLFIQMNLKVRIVTDACGPIEFHCTIF